MDLIDSGESVVKKPATAAVLVCVVMESTRRDMLPNPREKANILSKIFFAWTVPLFVKGYKKDLDMDDIYRPLHSDRSDGLGDRLERCVVF